MNIKLNDHYNLLEDSLRSGYIHIEKIYKRLQTIDDDKYINIRTGYPIKYHLADSDYIYFNGKYRLCWNLEAIEAEYNPLIIEKIWCKYEEWLDDYAKYNDNERIRILIEEEKQNIIRDTTGLFSPENRNSYIEQRSFDSERDGSFESENSFICKNDEVIRDDGRKRKIFRKRLGRRHVYENINAIYCEDMIDKKSFLKKRGRLIRKNKGNLENIFEEGLYILPNEEEIHISGKKNKIIIDSEEEIHVSEKKIKIIIDSEEEI